MAASRQSDDSVTESSPLLGGNDIDTDRPIERVDDNGTPHGEYEADEGLERQVSLGDRQKQYEGMPEVRKRLKYIFPAVAIGIFLAAADQTIIVSSYGKIGSEMKALSQTSWIATAYFLSLTSFQPLFGKLSDIFGRKPCLLFGYVIFGLGCLFCGLAQNMSQLIAARAFAGIGGAGMSTVVSILLSDVVPLRERGQWQGYANVVYAAGAASGAPLSGVLADSVGWRFSFLGQVPLCLAALVAVSFVLHLPKRDDLDLNWKKKLRRVDFLGAAALITTVFAFLLALDRGSNVSWGATITVVSMSVAIPLALLFAVVETKAKEPIAPGRILSQRAMLACYLWNFFSLGGWIAAHFYSALYFQTVTGLTATGAGIRLLPATFASVSGSLFGGYYMRKTGKYYCLTLTASIALVTGMLAILLCSGVLINNTVGILLGMSVAGFSVGIGLTTTLISIIANAGRDDQAIATACSYLFRSLGSVFGISMSATVANQALRSSLASQLPALGLSEERALAIADSVRQSLKNLRSLEPAVREVVIKSYGKSITVAFGLQLALLTGALLSALFIREKALSR